MLHITTQGQVVYPQYFSLLYFYDGLEQFAELWRDKGWVPTFDIEVKGYTEGIYKGFFKIWNKDQLVNLDGGSLKDLP